MPKPDKVLRSRPLKEVGAALVDLKKVVLFHPDPIVEELERVYCVCRKGERYSGTGSKGMIQCEVCWDWFHTDCVGLPNDGRGAGDDWQCEWCRSVVDRQGFQRWETNRLKAKLRHQNDIPRRNGGTLDGDVPKRFSAPPTWDGKVQQVRELARRSAVKKRKLKAAVEKLVGQGGHHVVDAEGVAGLEARPVDDGLVDELVGAGLVDEADCDSGD